MGKRARKTRWRALDIADDHSDSEESNTNFSVVSSRYSRSITNGYYSKYSYSSQSTPARRRYNQYDGSSKSTRSSSTTSENKITFNEDEYTRITTPRQDVLFKKGYLNKPRSYQTQTSTGNSTISTGNSTENGTPDHQSTDLDYESQFVFPNGFVDQNGIYYVNSYEPYPLMLFNPPTYYHEFSNVKSKRYSTGSLSESMSPNNEEVTSQDLNQSGGEASNSGVSDYSGGPPVFNMVYPGYYVNGACTPTDLANDENSVAEPVKKLKKRRERKSSKTIPGDSSEYTDENSSDERNEDGRLCVPDQSIEGSASEVAAQNDGPNVDETHKTANNSHDQSLPNGCADEKTEPTAKVLDTKPSILKPDAEEFVPRAYQTLGPPAPHIKMIPPNFVPIPLVPISDFGTQNFAPHPAAFIPPGIPINFIPHHLGAKMFPAPAPGFVSFPPPVVHEAKIEENDPAEEKVVNADKGAGTPAHTPVSEARSKTIDIATVVSKLEAVKQQEKRQDAIGGEDSVAKPAINDSKCFRNTTRPSNSQNTNNRRNNYYNKYRNSPVRNGYIHNGSPHHFRHSSANNGGDVVPPMNYGNSPIRRVEVLQKPLINRIDHPPPIQATVMYTSTSTQSSPEKFQKKSWKPNGYQNGYKNGSPKRMINKVDYQKPSVTYSPSRNPHESADAPVVVSNNALSMTSEPKPEHVKPKPNNHQWIPVASRKKKKNKALEEDVDTDVNDDMSKDDLFETYDVNQLVDVVPSSQNVAEEKKIEDILTSIAQTETIPINSPSSPTNIPEVSHIEKNIIDKIEEEHQVEIEPTPAKEEELNIDAVDEETFKPKKKSKKGTQKPLTKKVIITDIFSDLSVTSLETKSPLKKPANKPVPDKEPSPAKESACEVETEKKPKKKKKNKANKSTSDNNKPTSNESFDVLLEGSLTGESFEKTNDEISQELDKLIQRGMYSSLQEKIKSINVEPEVDDDFFKTFSSSALAAPVKDKSSSAAALKTTPDFNRIFQSTRQFLKPNMVSVDHDIKDSRVDNIKDTKSTSSTADAADSSAGLVLGVVASEVHETPLDVDPETPAENEETLYPITRAVKEWMCKTRETTPEVEILKSPSVIHREFGLKDNGDESDSDLEDDEVTLFASDQDLLECWENELPAVRKDCDLSKDTRKLCADGKSCDKCRTDRIKLGEEEIEVYESKYGRNDAFLHLQREVRKRESETPPRPGPLPVCCSLQ